MFPEGAGPEVTARDLVYSWKRVANFHLASPQYSGIFENRIKGLDEWFAYTEKTPKDKIDWDRPVSGLQTPDDYTLVITLVEPYPQLRYNLAHTPTAVVSRKAVEYWGDKFKEHPIGTGAYMMKEQLKEQRIVLVANPIYRGGPDVQPGTQLSAAERMPHIQKIQYEYFLEDLPVWLLFRQGMFDVGGIPKDSFKDAIAGGELTPQMRKDGVKLIKAPLAEVWYYGFNMMDPVVGKNKALRQAMSMAFDRDTYIHVYLNDRGEKAIGPIPPGFPTYDAKKVNVNSQYNLEAAKAKLKEAEKFQGGPIPELTLLMPGTDTTAPADGGILREQHGNDRAEKNEDRLPQLGSLPGNDRFQTRAGLRVGVGLPITPDEQTFLQLFYGKNVGTNGINSSNYQNPAFDALYEKARVMNPGPELNGLYKQMEDIVMDDAPWLITNYGITFTLYYDWLENLKLSEYSHCNRMYQSLDSAKREERIKKLK